MATRTWNGSAGIFAVDGNWTQQVAPAFGDTAVITTGTVTAAGSLPGSLILALGSLNNAGPTLILSDMTLTAAVQIGIKAGATLQLRGAVTNQGTISISGSNTAAVSLQVGARDEDAASNFINKGTILVSDTNLQIATGKSGDQLQNDGLISIRSLGKLPELIYVSPSIAGTGTVSLGRYITFEAESAVGAGQNFLFMPGYGGTATLRLDAGTPFAGTITGFGAGDAIQLLTAQWNVFTYAPVGLNSGVLTMLQGGVVVRTLLFEGAYNLANFGLKESVPFGSSQASTTITFDDKFFDAGYYLVHNPDVAAAGLEPYQHFMTYGWREGRDPSLLFSVSKYLAVNPDVRAAGLNPLYHYEAYGRLEGRAAFPAGGAVAADLLVDPAYYAQQLGASLVPAGVAGQQQAAWGYDATGWQQGFNPDALFDTSYYLAQYADVKAAGVNPLKHYERYGWHEGRDPSLSFSTTKYLSMNPDVKSAAIDPLLHYLQYGQNEGRIALLPGSVSPADTLVNAAFYDKQLGATLIPTGIPGQLQAAASYDAVGWRRGLNPDSFFDTRYYLSHNLDVAAAQLDPVKHYEQYGWREGRDPSGQFSTTRYLAAYSDVRAAGIDPLEHYLLHGQAEGRTAFAV